MGHIILLLYKYFDSHIQFLNNSLHKQLYSQYDYLLSTIPFFPFLKKKNKNPITNIQKKNTISPISKTYFKDIKNLKLNGATILDLSKKQKPETLIVVVKKKSMMGNCKSIYSCTTYVRHTSRKRRT